jgi:environmental stress-induced protein Ves
VGVILRAAERRAAPWKNGGGLTREVAVDPAGSALGDFEWRVSIAEVHRRGPFSPFPGVDRHMALLSGRLALAMADRGTLTLVPESAPLTFAGELAVTAEPLHSPVTDLNVMTRRGRCVARLRRCSLPGATQVRLEADTTLILALTELTLRAASMDARLSALDAARFAASAESLSVEGVGDDAGFWLIEIRASHQRGGGADLTA